MNATALAWEVAAQANSGESDRLEVKQSVTAAHPVRVVQATLLQLDKPISMSVDMPADAVPGRGGVSLALRAQLADELTGVRDYMSRYPYTCIEQRVSRGAGLLRHDGLSVCNMFTGDADKSVATISTFSSPARQVRNRPQPRRNLSGLDPSCLRHRARVARRYRPARIEDP